MDTNQINRTDRQTRKEICVVQRPVAQWRKYLGSILLSALLLLTACGGGGAQSTPTPFPTPIVPEKPTYTVQRGAVAKTLEFRGRVSPVTEKELFFETDGYVRAVHVAQGDLVEVGDLLAELEIGDLENQLAQAEVVLQTAELRLSQAEQENADALAEAELNLQRARLQLRQAEQENADALAEARAALEKAQLAQALGGPTEADIAVAQSAVDSAQAQLEELLSGPDAQSVEIARLNWDLARNALWQAQLERDAIKGRSGVPGYQRDLADAAVGSAQASARIAELQYELAGKGATDEAIRVAQAAVDQARAQATTARNSYSYTVQLQALEVEIAELRVAKLERGVDPLLAQEVELAELRQAKLERGADSLLPQEVEKARIDLQRIQSRIEDARLVALFDGRILSLSVREGGQATAFKTALILGDPGALEVTADLGADKLTQMSVGQAATIRLLNRPEQDWSGHVRQLPYPYGGGAGEQASDDKATRITLDDPSVTLEIGELATVIILLEQKDDVLWLPPAAVRSFQGRDFVVIQDGDRQLPADVRLGLESEERIEILEGVEEGQVVVGP
jgi:multidrug efflux pump subunit AcrA (membrane-fusion protein)